MRRPESLVTGRSAELISAGRADFASDYYETEIDRDTVAHVAALRPLTDDAVRALNLESSLAAVRTEVAATGYPIAPAVS